MNSIFTVSKLKMGKGVDGRKAKERVRTLAGRNGKGRGERRKNRQEPAKQTIHLSLRGNAHSLRRLEAAAGSMQLQREEEKQRGGALFSQGRRSRGRSFLPERSIGTHAHTLEEESDGRKHHRTLLLCWKRAPGERRRTRGQRGLAALFALLRSPFSFLFFFPLLKTRRQHRLPRLPPPLPTATGAAAADTEAAAAAASEEVAGKKSSLLLGLSLFFTRKTLSPSPSLSLSLARSFARSPLPLPFSFFSSLPMKQNENAATAAAATATAAAAEAATPAPSAGTVTAPTPMAQQPAEAPPRPPRAATPRRTPSARRTASPSPPTSTARSTS